MGSFGDQSVATTVPVWPGSLYLISPVVASCKSKTRQQELRKPGSSCRTRPKETHPDGQGPIGSTDRDHAPAVRLRVLTPARLPQESLEPCRSAVEAPDEARVQGRVRGVKRRRERLYGPEVEDRVHRGGKELRRGRGEGKGGDGVRVASEGVGDGLVREGEDVHVVVDAADEYGLAVRGPFDLIREWGQYLVQD